MFGRVRMIVGSIPKCSGDIFGNLGKCSGTFGWPLEQFWEIFGNLRKVVGNLRKIIKNAIITDFDMIKRTLHVNSKI